MTSKNKDKIRSLSTVQSPVPTKYIQVSHSSLLANTSLEKVMTAKDNNLNKIKALFDTFKQKQNLIFNNHQETQSKSESKKQKPITNNQIIAVGVVKAIVNTKLRKFKREAFAYPNKLEMNWKINCKYLSIVWVLSK